MSLRQRLEQRRQIVLCIDAVGLAGLDQLIKVGAGVGAAHRIAEKPGLAPDDKRPDGVLARIVRDRSGAVIDIPACMHSAAQAHQVIDAGNFVIRCIAVAHQY